jgi:16S rRNA C967 or C1407 C5-methylase (RsmB/RsmF family)
MQASEKSPSRNMVRVAQSLFSAESEQRLFLDSLAGESCAQTAIVWLRNKPLNEHLDSATKAPWLPDWIELATPSARPGKSIEHTNGDIYCLDLSSTFAGAAFSRVEISKPSVIDVCAAPGGKGVLAYRYLQPSFMVANEAIRKRTAQLISNYKRCKLDPAAITSYDPKDLAEKCGPHGELVIVDAPCSGQSLVLKGLAAPGAFHQATIGMNERRQRRILAHSQALVPPGGYLLYSTCTFSQEENESNMHWLLRTFPEFEAVSIESLSAYRSNMSDFPSYRLWPFQGFGAGSYCCLLRRQGTSGGFSLREASSSLWKLWRSASVHSSDGPNSERPRTTAKEGTKKREKREQRWRYRPGTT